MRRGCLTYSHYVMRSFPLYRIRVLRRAKYDLLDNHHCDRQKKRRKKRHPGCLAHAVIGTIYSVVANQRRHQYTCNVLQRRRQPRPTTIYVYFRGGGGGTHLLVALVFWPLITHPFRHTAPFLLLIETPPTFGRSLCFFHILHRNSLLILSPSCFAVCSHHLSPKKAIVFRYSLSYQTLPCHTRPISLSSLLTHPVPPFTFSHYVRPTLYCYATRAHICSHVLLLPTTGLSLLSGGSRSPTQNRIFSFFA